MELREYLNQRFLEIHNSTDRIVMNELNNKLLTILRYHDLGMVGNFRDYRFVSIKTKYQNVLRDFYKVQRELIKLDIPVKLSDILYYEHLYSFGFQNIQQNKLYWSNLELNFLFYLDPNQITIDEELNDDLDYLLKPIIGMDEKEFDDDFLYFISHLLNTHFKTKGYKITFHKRRLSVHLNNRIISVFPESPNISVLKHLFYSICSFENKKQSLKNDYSNMLELIEFM